MMKQLVAACLINEIWYIIKTNTQYIFTSLTAI